MKRIIFLVMLVVLLNLSFASTVFAASDPVGRCPVGFELHDPADHDHEMGHLHAGTLADQNGDGWICVKHLASDPTIHVHVDNWLPLK